MNDRVLRRDEGEVCVLTLNRPESLNALDTATFEALDAHFVDLEAQADSIGCVVLRGAGRAFCAGADLKAMAGVTVDPRFKPGIVERLARLPQPVIAAVHGACYTGGLEMALACDMILADTTARFADTHGKWGLIGAWGMSQRLPHRIGPSAAKRIMLSAQPIDGVEAHRLGLVDILAEEGGLDATVMDFAAQVADNSRYTNLYVKRALAATEGMAIDAALQWEAENYPGRSPDHNERIARFAKKG
ncbi:enoyl-CoA hydratase/isomerase family protein [Novosphingobium aquae]|uniref:Enoyl-CoA hydratase/isomerase family protein n=1 Tax=Novosphingobium aquae TaxID=3133435 RepID=A0ABU8S3C5_9SPHN